MIEYIAYVVVGFAVLRLLVSLANFLFRESLPKHPLVTDADERSVSILIPARNEATNIGNILSDLKQMPDKSIGEIIVFDDLSEDDTAEIVLKHALEDPRLRLIRSSSLPEGWVGKSHGCHHLAQEAKGDYLLFLDADVRVQPAFVDRALSYMKRKKVDLLSLFPTQEMKTLAEQMTVPNMHIILLTLLPLPLVRLSGFSSLSAANGQCMLFHRATYDTLRPHEAYRHSKAEDIDIARYFKRQKRKVSCLTGEAGIYCRMYNDLRSAINGFAKNVTYFFGSGNSYLSAGLYWLLTTFGVVAVAHALPSVYLWGYVAAVVLSRLFVSLTARQSPLLNVLLIIPQQLMLGAFILRSWLNKRKRSFEWKGRTL